MLVSEWAAANRSLPASLTSQPGPWRNEVAPYLIEPMNCLSESSDVRMLAFMKGTQICLTTGLIENYIGYTIDVCPRPILYITGDKDMAEISMELKIDRLLESSGLQSKIFAQVEKKSAKKTGDTKTKKEFPGGFLMAVGPRSGSKLRSLSVPNLLFDECDAYPQEVSNDGTKEGDPMALALRRTDSYEHVRKVTWISTPLDAATSHISRLFNKGDKRYYYIPCPHCGEMQVLNFFTGMKWELDDDGNLDHDSVHYDCPHCHNPIHNDDKVKFLPAGEWRATAKPTEPNFRSYHLSSLYSPVGFRSWESIVQEYVQIKGDPAKERAFINLVLGEPYQERGEAPAYDKVLARAEPTWKSGEIPREALILTIGADVQGDRIECELVAWGVDKESWSVSYDVFMGDTDDLRGPAWIGLRDKILTQYKCGSRMMTVDVACIDSSYKSDTVYAFCAQFGSGVYPVAGEDGIHGRIVKAFKIPELDIIRYDLNANYYKDEIYRYLKHDAPLPGEAPPWGYCHFPSDRVEKYFKMLTAEDRVSVRAKNGTVKYMWQNVRRRRNEALDCRVYSLAGVYIMALIMATSEEMESVPWPEFWKHIKEVRG